MRQREESGALGRRAQAGIGAGWLAASLAWTPAALMTSPGVAWTAGTLAAAFVQMLIHFAPWALAVPVFVRLSRRFPIGLGGGARHIGLFAALGLAVIPLFTALGVVAARLLLGAVRGTPPAEALAGFGQAVLITGLFAIPTYAAIVAIGQTMAYLERYRQRERLLSRARAEALRAQVTPHFLFNALNAISALIHSDPGQADSAMVRLAVLLRATLDRPEWTSLRDEVALIADYVELHRLLLGERLAVELEIAPDAWDARLPSLLLQPLVENALVHGLSRLAGGGTLSIAARREQGQVRIEIANDAPPGPLGPAGVGLANVRRRLAASCAAAASFDIAANEGRVRVQLRLPYALAEQA